MNKREIAKKAREFDRQTRALEAKYKPTIKKALDKQTGAFFDYAEENGLGPALLILDSLVPSKPIEDVLYRIYVVEGKRQVVREQAELNRLYGSEVKSGGAQYQTKALRFLRSWIDRITSFFTTDGFKEVTAITETTRDWLRGKAQKGVEEQYTIRQIRETMRFEAEEINAKRANVIARTEVVSSLGNANFVAAMSSNIRFTKQWVSAYDDRTRQSHVNMQGEIQLLEQPYSNGGMYPGDPALEAAERIQCRCASVYIPLRDAQGIIMRKN